MIRSAAHLSQSCVVRTTVRAKGGADARALSGICSQLEEAVQQARQYGWWVTSIGIDDALLAIDARGAAISPTRKGDRATIEEITPKSKQEAHPRSLSAQYGFDRFPLHTDGAYLPTVPSILILEAAGQAVDAETLLWSSRRLGSLPTKLARALETGVFIVRGGERSIYAHALVGDWLRFDPVCMCPLDREASYVRDWFSEAPVERHVWGEEGETLLIDNTTTLHGRSAVARGSRRKLRRLLVDWRER